MISEASKREKAAALVGALSFATSAAQSPKDFVRTGHVEAPGTALMQKWGHRRGEAERNLDQTRVSQAARNRKKKNFEEFILEARGSHRDKIGHKEYDEWKSEVSSHHEKHGHTRGVSKRSFNGIEYEMRNKSGKGKPKVWAASRVADRKASAERRKETLKPISDAEFLSHAKRNLEKNPREVAAAAADVEIQTKKRKREKARKATKETGEKHDLDHMQPQPTRRRPENRERFRRITPGDSASNLTVMKHSDNTGKQDRPPRKGEPGHTLTRASAIRHSTKKGKKLLSNIDKLVSKIRNECYELEESSSGERGNRRLSSRGPATSKSDRNKQRQDKSTRAALSKAGFRRSAKPIIGKGSRPTKWTETSSSTHHNTETGTYANQSDYAASKIGNLGPKGNKPTSKRALQAKQIRKQLGGDRTSRPVHDVAVNKNRSYDDDKSSTMTKGRSFRKEVTKGVSANLKKAGAKPGDIMTSTPTSDSRSRMYVKTHNAITNKKTGTTANRVSG
jgi:hypothetical protein